jgi:hypothetical protein
VARFQFLFIKWALRYMYLPVGEQLASTLGFLDQEILLDMPFIVQACQSFQELNLPPLRRVPTPLMPTFPPHVELSSSICVDLLSSAVNSCLLNTHKIASKTSGNCYPQHLQIYTNRYRSATGSVSAGLYVPSKHLAIGWLLNPVHTVLGAELFAIF